MPFPKRVKIVEVSPRDGLQNELQQVETAIKIELVNRLANAGIPVIEVTSFVSTKWVPQLKDAKEVFAGITKKPGVCYPVLIPNVRGLENALSVGVKDIAIFTTPSEQFSQKNTNRTVAESLKHIEEVIQIAKKHQLWIRGYISCALGCPYEGEIAIKKVADLSLKLFKMGCEEISLGDTIGVGTPLKSKHVIEAVAAHVPIHQIAVHFHDTYGQALANIYAALECGVATVDSSVAGLGGCPYAKGASGNVATEDVLYMLKGLGIETGVDLKKMVAVGRFISEKLGRKPYSKVNAAISE